MIPEDIIPTTIMGKDQNVLQKGTPAMRRMKGWPTPEKQNWLQKGTPAKSLFQKGTLKPKQEEQNWPQKGTPATRRMRDLPTPEKQNWLQKSTPSTSLDMKSNHSIPGTT